MRFSFTGNLNLNGLETKNPFHRVGTTSSGKPYESFNVSVVAEKNNRAYTEVFGMVQDKIKTMDTDNNKVEIDWEDRNDPDIIKSVAGFKKHVVKLGDERKEFISDYDFVKYLASHADDLKDIKATVTGQSSVNVYNGKISQRFTIQNIYEADDESKNQLRITTPYYFNKNSFDFSDWNTEHKIIINGYIQTYIDKDTGNKYVELPTVLDCSKINWDNEKHVNLVKYKLKMLGCDLVDNKPKFKSKGSNFYSIATILAYQNGAEQVDFTEDMLTDTQKELLELGVKTLEDFRPAGNVYGERVQIYKIVDFDIRGDYENGYVDTELSESEFEDEIYVPIKPESVEDLEEEEEEKPSKKNKNVEPEDSDDDEDLFG